MIVVSQCLAVYQLYVRIALQFALFVLKWEDRNVIQGKDLFYLMPAIRAIYHMTTMRMVSELCRLNVKPARKRSTMIIRCDNEQMKVSGISFEFNGLQFS